MANVAPTDTVIGPDAVPSSGAVALQVDLGDVSATDTLSATIDWGDGTVGHGHRPRRADRQPHLRRSGEFSVKVEVTDGTASTSATHSVTVSSPPPVVVLSLRSWSCRRRW